MDTVKSAVFVACLMGIVSTLIDISAPEGSSKRQLLVITGIITLLAVMSNFIGKGFKITTEDISLEAQSEYYSDRLSNETNEKLLSIAESKYEEYFISLLNSNGIEPSEMEIVMKISDSNEISAESIYVCIENYSDSAKVRELIHNDLPDIYIYIKAVEKESEDD